MHVTHGFKIYPFFVKYINTVTAYRNKFPLNSYDKNGPARYIGGRNPVTATARHRTVLCRSETRLYFISGL